MKSFHNLSDLTLFKYLPVKIILFFLGFTVDFFSSNSIYIYFFKYAIESVAPISCYPIQRFLLKLYQYHLLIMIYVQVFDGSIRLKKKKKKPY
jgi:hypothetical protein